MGIFRCIAIDMGASNVRLVLGTIENKRLNIEEIHRFTNEMQMIDGHYRWDIENIQKEIKHGIAKAVDQGYQIDSISTDSWGVDFVLLDEQDIPLEWPVAYRDDRTMGMKEEWEKRMRQQETFQRTGINHYQFNTLYQFLYIKNSEIIRKTSRILFTANYINFYLSGEKINELTLASTSQMLRQDNFDWDDDILSHVNLRKDQLQKPARSGKVLGSLREHFGSPGTKVVLSPSHDSACAALAVPAKADNYAFISTGTWCVTGVKSKVPFISEEAFKAGITNELTAEGTFRALKNLMGLWLIQGLQKSLPGNLSYSDMENLALEADPYQFIINPNDPAFYNPDNMKEAFDRYLKQTVNQIPESPAAYIRCAYDSLGLSFRHTLALFEKIRGRKFDNLHLIGGGCQSEILSQLSANATGLKVYAGPVEGAAIGNCLAQAWAMNEMAGLEETSGILENSFEIKEYLPDPHPQMDEKYQEFLKLLF